MMRRSDPKVARLVSVIAATVIALACGTNYIYSAWAPQFAQKLKLSSTQSNLIGTAGNLGMYASGIPLGMMVDAKGPRTGVALGAILLGGGYYPIAKAYNSSPGDFSVAALCLFSFFTGAGSAAAFQASLKTSALNYPESRGTATAFPLAAFGLSAFFFSTVSSLALPHDTSKFLLLLASGTFILPVISFFFLRVIPPSLHHSRTAPERQPLRRTRSAEDRDRNLNETRGAPSDLHTASALAENTIKGDVDIADAGDETSSLLSKSSASSPGDLEASKQPQSNEEYGSPHLDIRGFALLPHLEFWQLFSMLGLLTGIGLMTINNIGNDAQALWKHYNNKADPHFIEKNQVMHVSILSLGSFAGRLLSGIGSDLLVSKLDRSRFWCLFVSALTFCVAQLLATAIENPRFLSLVSGLTGLAYGILFGVYPTLVAHAFGVDGLSQNWGTMTLAPVISGNIFNILYGRIYDSHSVMEPSGDRVCLKGLICYRSAYFVTFFAAVAGGLVCLWSVWHENEVHKKKLRSGVRTNHERIA